MRWVAAVLILLVLAGVAPVLMSIGCVGFDDIHLTACGPIVAIAWQWQSLIGGLLALIGAGFAGWMVKKQIDDQRVQFAEGKRHRERTATMRFIIKHANYMVNANRSLHMIEQAIQNSTRPMVGSLRIRPEDFVDDLADLPPTRSVEFGALSALSDETADVGATELAPDGQSIIAAGQIYTSLAAHIAFHDRLLGDVEWIVPHLPSQRRAEIVNVARNIAEAMQQRN